MHAGRTGPGHGEGRRHRQRRLADAAVVLKEDGIRKPLRQVLQFLSRQHARIRGAATLKRCLGKLREDLEGLLRHLEMLFSDLETLQGELLGWLKEDIDRHEPPRGAQSGTRYVYASAEAKSAIWESIKPVVQGAKLPRS